MNGKPCRCCEDRLAAFLCQEVCNESFDVKSLDLDSLVRQALAIEADIKHAGKEEPFLSLECSVSEMNLPSQCLLELDAARVHFRDLRVAHRQKSRRWSSIPQMDESLNCVRSVNLLRIALLCLWWNSGRGAHQHVRAVQFAG